MRLSFSSKNEFCRFSYGARRPLKTDLILFRFLCNIFLDICKLYCIIKLQKWSGFTHKTHEVEEIFKKEAAFMQFNGYYDRTLDAKKE